MATTLQAVAAAEVAEGVVADHDGVAPRSSASPSAVAWSSRSQVVLAAPAALRRVVARVRRVDRRRAASATASATPGQPQRVEPEVRVAGRGGPARRPAASTSTVAGRVLLDGVVDRRLEALLVDHHVGVGELGGLRGRQLEVVRLRRRAGSGSIDPAWPPAIRSATYASG